MQWRQTNIRVKRKSAIIRNACTYGALLKTAKLIVSISYKATLFYFLFLNVFHNTHTKRKTTKKLFLHFEAFPFTVLSVEWPTILRLGLALIFSARQGMRKPQTQSDNVNNFRPREQPTSKYTFPLIHDATLIHCGFNFVCLFSFHRLWASVRMNTLLKHQFVC